MRRLFSLLAASVLLYLIVFAGLADRPLTLGLLLLELRQKAARLAALPSPKFVIIAGSNGSYSHSCLVLGAMLNRPCENASIAVGIGLDEMFLRYAPYLHAGDIVYMPMEFTQYRISQAEADSAVDGAFLLRHDRALLAQLPAGRILGAMFCCNLADFLESLAEMPSADSGLIQPGELLAREYDPQGDRIGTASPSASVLARLQASPAPGAAAIRAGYGAELIAGFVAAEHAKGVIIIGGLPTRLAGGTLSPALLGATSAVFTQHGGMFLQLPNDSEYPRADFYDSAEHLSQPCQILHSIALGAVLLRRLGLPPAQAPITLQARARECPSPAGAG